MILLIIVACAVFGAEDKSDIMNHRSVIVSNLVMESHAIIRGTLATGVMGEVSKEGDSIHFVYVNIVDVLKRPKQTEPYPYDQLIKGEKIQILWYSQENGKMNDKVSLPYKVGEMGIFFLRIQGHNFVNTDRWFSYHPDNSKLLEEIRHRTTF